MCDHYRVVLGEEESPAVRNHYRGEFCRFTFQCIYLVNGTAKTRVLSGYCSTGRHCISTLCGMCVRHCDVGDIVHIVIGCTGERASV